MPPINKFKCDKCDFSMPEGWGGCLYIIRDGKREYIPHPLEFQILYDKPRLWEYLFKELPLGRMKKGIEKITGFNSDCVCFKCLKQFVLDVEKDERKCPYCGCKDVKTVHELVGNICPKCKDGIFREIETGTVC